MGRRPRTNLPPALAGIEAPTRPRRGRPRTTTLSWPMDSPVLPPPVLSSEIVIEAPNVIRAPVLHAVAKCRWCHGPFRRMDERHWICLTEACAERQLSQAMRKAGHDTGPILFLPLPLQIEVDEDPTTNLLVAGAAGVSKSTGCRWNLYRKCRQIPGYRALLLRCTYDQLQKNHLAFMPQELSALGDATYKAQQRIAIFHHEDNNDSMIFAGFCNVAADIAQHVGPEWDSVNLEEGVTLLPKAIEEISAKARGSGTARVAHERLGLRAGVTRIWSNPGGRAHRYLVQMHINKNPDPEEFPKYDPAEYGYLSCTLEDNPALSEDYDKKTLSGLSAARYKQLRYGDWTALAGQFFESFDPAIHLTHAEPA